MTTATDTLDFTHLHVHTEHSPLDGLIKAKKLPEVVKSLGMDACAISDHGSLTGSLRFHEACLKAGIKPIIAMEAYLAIGSRFERNTETVESNDDSTDADEGKEKSKKYHHVTIVARDETGWKSLLAIHNKSESSFWYKPRADMELLAEHGAGLMILTGCLAGTVAGPLSRAGKADWEAKRLTKAGGDAEQIAALEASRDAYRAAGLKGLNGYIDAVGRDNVFLEVMYHSIGAERHAFREIRRLSKETGIPMVATNDCHYTHEGDDVAHDHFLAVGTKATIDSPDRFSFNGTPDYYVKSPEQMYAVMEQHTSNAEAIADWRQACANTRLVVDRVAERTIPEGKMRLPKFPVPEGETEQSWFHKLVLDGAKERWGDEQGRLTKEVKARLRIEENIIVSMGFPAYFLIVADVINWARSDYMPADWITLQAGGTVPEDRELKKPILVGPGRGSAAGSACSYALGIVGVDPLRYELLFERFLEPGRAGMPDIDVDFERDRRGEVLRYLQVRWGRENVAHLGTIGTGKTKAVLKDAARILKPTRPNEDTQYVIDSLRAAAARIEDENLQGVAIAATDEQMQHFLTDCADMDATGTVPAPAGLRKSASQLMGEAMKEANRVGGEYQSTGNKLAALAPSMGAESVPLAEIMITRDDSTAAFHQLVDSSKIAAEIVKAALPLEGISKQEGIHACGFIISPDPLDELVPMRWASHSADASPDDPRVITWEGAECDNYGLLKMDVLGLMNLDVAHKAMDNIAASGGPTLSLDSLPDPGSNDPAVAKAFAMMSAGQTDGVFQAESQGMKQVFQDVQPDTLDDLSAVVALYRPGPMKAGMPEDYARRKNGLAEVTYDAFTDDPIEAEWISSVFGSDYGLAIYQETIMRLGTVVAGFDAAQRSKLRKAIGKKDQAVMDQVHELWNEGAGKEFYDPDTNELISPVFSPEASNRLWDFISGAASYLFNKSHSVAYGYLAYVTAYLKANWPVEYGAAILAVVDKGKDEKRLATLQSLRSQGIEVLPPDVNTGQPGTAAVDGKVVMGMAEIKGVGSIAEYIVAERDKNGPFIDINDLARRVKDDENRHITTGALAALAEAGAMDCLPGTRLGQVMASKGALSGAVPPTGWTWSELEESRRQRQRIGASLGVHPIFLAEDVLDDLYGGPNPHGVSVTKPKERFARKFGRQSGPNDVSGTTTWCHMEDLRGGDKDYAGTVGVVQSWAEKSYKGGRRANFTLEGTDTSISGVIWNDVMTKLAASGLTPEVGDLVLVSGRLQVREVTMESEDDEGESESETITVRELVGDHIEVIAAGPATQAPEPSTGQDGVLTAAWRQAVTAVEADAERVAAAKAAARSSRQPARASSRSAAPARGSTAPSSPAPARKPAVKAAAPVPPPAPKPIPTPTGEHRVVVNARTLQFTSNELEGFPDGVPQALRDEVSDLGKLPLGKARVNAGAVFRKRQFTVLVRHEDETLPAEPVNGSWQDVDRGWQLFVPAQDVSGGGENTDEGSAHMVLA